MELPKFVGKIRGGIRGASLALMGEEVEDDMALKSAMAVMPHQQGGSVGPSGGDLQVAVGKPGLSMPYVGMPVSPSAPGESRQMFAVQLESSTSAAPSPRAAVGAGGGGGGAGGGADGGASAQQQQPQSSFGLPPAVPGGASGAPPSASAVAAASAGSGAQRPAGGGGGGTTGSHRIDTSVDKDEDDNDMMTMAAQVCRGLGRMDDSVRNSFPLPRSCDVNALSSCKPLSPCPHTDCQLIFDAGQPEPGPVVDGSGQIPHFIYGPNYLTT